MSAKFPNKLFLISLLLNVIYLLIYSHFVFGMFSLWIVMIFIIPIILFTIFSYVLYFLFDKFYKLKFKETLKTSVHFSLYIFSILISDKEIILLFLAPSFIIFGINLFDYILKRENIDFFKKN